MKQLKLIFAALTIISINTVAQQKNYTLPQVVPQSPDVASLGKFGDIPVSLSTGMANISIPLLNIEVGKFTLPITLSYHNNGLKVDEIPSSIGMGWSLQAGGAISYQQRGIDDFKPGGMFTGALSDLTKYFSGTMTTDERYWYLERIMNGEEDSEYDLYHFNFLGQSGSFYFDNTQQPRVMPKSDLKISKITNGIKVVDIEGNQFHFDAPETSLMYPAADVEIRPAFNGISAYYLSKIITKDNRIISFRYKSFYLQYNKTNQLINHYPLNSSNPECPPSSMNYFDTYVYQEYLLPDSILFDQGYIKFLHSSGSREDLKKLSANTNVPSVIGFYEANITGQRIKEFSFTQGYFGNNDRLKLASVQEIKGTIVSRKWTLRYYESSGFPLFNSKSQDHWGYANGAQNSSLIPDADYLNMVPYWKTYPVTYADRTSRFDASLAGMLKEIVYPTGGSTLFEYEPNQIKVSGYQQLSSPFMQVRDNSYFQNVAGANTLDDPDGDGVVSGTFVIAEGGQARIRAFRELDPTHFEDPLFEFTGPSATALYHAFAIGCTNDHCQAEIMATIDAGTYTYKLTAGRWWNPSTGTYFKRHINFEIDMLKYGAPIPYIIGGNRIARITTSDSTGVTPNMIKKFVYADSIHQVAFRNIPYYMTLKDRKVLGSSPTYCSDCGSEYTIHDESVRPYAGNLIEYQHVTEYDSSKTGLLGKIEHTFMLSVNDAGSNSQPYVAAVNTSWRTGTLRSDKIYKTVGSSSQLVQEIQNAYSFSDRLNTTNGIKVDYSSYCEGSSPLMRSHNISLSTLFTEQYYLSESKKIDYLSPQSVTSQQNFTANSGFHTLPVFIDNLDSEGQLVREKMIYSSDYNTANATSSEALGIKYLNGQNILVPVETIKIKRIAGTDYVIGGTINCYKPDKPAIDKVFSLKIDAPVALGSFVQSSIVNGNFQKDSRYELRATFEEYDVYNNPVSFRTTNNAPVSYIWDYQKLYPVAEAINAVPSDIAYTSFETIQKGNWTFTGVSVTDASAPTGVKSYNLANGSITRSGLKSVESYLVSYWTKNATPYVLAGTQAGYPLKGRTINGWTNYVHKVRGVTSITFPASGYIDELRLHPADATMTTYAYREHVGLINRINSQNQIIYYEYDDFNRLKLIKDQDGKILKQYDYQYQKPVTR